MKRNVVFVSPRLTLQKGDFLGSGVPYWPIELATLAGAARACGDVVTLVDLFGAAPRRLEERADHYLQGAPLSRHLGRAEFAAAHLFVVFAISYMSHAEVLAITAALRAAYPQTPVAVLENAQAVTAYALPGEAESLFGAGAAALVCGDPHAHWDAIADWLLGVPGVLRPPGVMLRGELTVERAAARGAARHPLPAWDLLDLAGYWSLPYAHGPKTARYLPILTSRGCPYPCDFCVVPATSGRRWQGEEPAYVVEQMLALRDRFGVRDFHVEDLNPTVDHSRWEAICRLLVERNAGIRFYLVSGTKAETVRIDTVPLLARAGCRYLSISPESGSAALMKRIGKPFDYEHGAALVGACRANGIRTQACFLVGHPGETEGDHAASLTYLRRLVRAGLDEAAIFVVAPFAGSRLHAQSRIAVASGDALPSFSPRGRAGYAALAARRGALIRAFFIAKLGRGFDLWMQGLRALAGVPQTKMENLPRRVAFVTWLVLKTRLSARAGST